MKIYHRKKPIENQFIKKPFILCYINKPEMEFELHWYSLAWGI